MKSAFPFFFSLSSQVVLDFSFHKKKKKKWKNEKEEKEKKEQEINFKFI